MAEWFVDWFDSPYYHTLYKSRSESEAAGFIDNLEKALVFSYSQIFCDMACGKGRHSIYLNQKGYEVYGLDLSKNNISKAKEHENEKLHFFIHDIRDTFRPAFFDVVLNLFTSFGYFENNFENQAAIKAIAKSLKPGGLLVLDYMNSRKAIEEFNTQYNKVVDGITFQITKKIEKGYIFKRIRFNVSGKMYDFEERVKLLFLDDFKTFFKNSSLEIQQVYGNYALEPFHEHTSDRMVMLCKKTEE
jgi:SAM-dependent methyltransferase